MSFLLLHALFLYCQRIDCCFAHRQNGITPHLPGASARMGGIWAPPGPIVDAQGNLYVSVGNGAATGGSWDYTDAILKLSPGLQLEDAFAPQSWPQDNASDLDLGSMGPVFLPGGFIFIQGKSNQGYVLQANHLGGIGGQIQTISACSAGAYGGAAPERKEPCK